MNLQVPLDFTAKFAFSTLKRLRVRMDDLHVAVQMRRPFELAPALFARERPQHDVDARDVLLDVVVGLARVAALTARERLLVRVRAFLVILHLAFLLELPAAIFALVGLVLRVVEAVAYQVFLLRVRLCAK